MAPCAGGLRARRRVGQRTRALRGAGPGTWRSAPLPRLSSREPSTLTPEPSATRATGARRSADEIPSRCARGRAQPSRHSRRRRPQRPGACTCRVAARADCIRRHARKQCATLLLEAARRLATLDPTLARETYLDALSAAMFAGRFRWTRRKLAGGSPSRERGATAARAARARLSARRPGDAVQRHLRVGRADPAAGAGLIQYRRVRDRAVAVVMAGDHRVGPAVGRRWMGDAVESGTFDSPVGQERLATFRWLSPSRYPCISLRAN